MQSFLQLLNHLEILLLRSFSFINFDSTDDTLFSSIDFFYYIPFAISITIEIL